MNIRPLGKNQTVVTLPNQDEVFYSYSTPVAGWVCGKGFWRSTEFFSTTTSRHVGKYANTANVRELSPEETAALLEGYGV